LDLPVTIGGRITLTEIVQQTETTVQYAGVDWGHCWQCGATGTDVEMAFCEDCGAELGGNGAPCLVLTGDVPTDLQQGEPVIDGGRTFWVELQPTQATEPEPDPDAGLHISLRAGYASHHGQRSTLDEDSLLIVIGHDILESRPAPSVGLFAVADGMGGHASGEVASKRVIQVLAEELVPGLIAPALCGQPVPVEEARDVVQTAAEQANRRLTHEAHEFHTNMGSTLTMAFVHQSKAIVANVGDSRTYLWRGAVLEQITRDHSLVARLVEEGQLEPKEVYSHPKRSVIYRTMGDELEIEVDVFERDLLPGDQLVLCCDGVWEMIGNEGIELALLHHAQDPQAACDEMVEQANEAGGEDNISVIVVDHH
jgi:serine/threonine protein phosphatase PrpC